MSKIESDSAARLAHLRRIADDLNRRSRALSESARDTAAALATARSRVVELREAPQGFSYRSADRNAARNAVEQAEARVAELEKTFAAAQADADDASAEWSEAAQLLERCMDFARENGLPIPQVIGRHGPDPHFDTRVDAEVIG